MTWYDVRFNHEMEIEADSEREAVFRYRTECNLAEETEIYISARKKSKRDCDA